MRRPFSRRSKIAIAGLTVAAVAVPLLGISASASIADGNFLVHAWNTGDSKIEAYAGIKGAGSGESGVPAPAVTLASYSCGPMALKITDTMAKTSKTNSDLQSAGNGSEVATVDGFQSMYSLVSGDSALSEGFPSTGRPNQVFLSSTMAVPNRSDAYPVAAAYAKDYDTNCAIVDSRSPQAGKTFGYLVNYSTMSRPTEGRYTAQDGGLAASWVSVQADGSLTLDRRAKPNDKAPALSNRYPVALRSSGGTTTADMYLPEMKDGYNYYSMRVNTDGSGNMSYAKWNGTVASYGAIQGIGAPTRANGPSSISWNAAGELTALSSPGKTITAPFTAAHYNELTGQNWDGSYEKPSSLDLTMPFTPTLKN